MIYGDGGPDRLNGCPEPALPKVSWQDLAVHLDSAAVSNGLAHREFSLHV